MNFSRKSTLQGSKYFAKFNHVCEILDLEDPLWFYYPGNDFCSKLKRRFARCRTVSDNRIDSRFLRSQGVVREERRRHFEENSFMIHPFSDFRKWWEFFMVIVLVITLFFVPITIVTLWTTAKKLNRVLKTLKVIVMVSDVFLIINFVLNFFTGIVCISQKKIVMNPKEVAKEYLKSYFWVDILTIPPIQFLSFFIRKRRAVFYSYQFCKIFTFFTFYKYYNNVAECFNVNYTKKKLILLISSVMFYFQWICCFLMFLFLLNCGILTKPVKNYKQLVRAINMREPVTNLTFLSANISYPGSLYRATLIILLIDYGHAPPYNNAEKLIVMVIWIISRLLYIQLLAYIFQVLRARGSSTYRYTEMLKQLKEYMSHKHLPIPMQKRLLSYFEFRFQNTYFKEAHIMKTISSNLKQEVTMHNCSKLVEKVTFFKNLPSALLVRIVSCLDAEIYLSNDIIIKANTKADCMFFIASGTVAVFTKSGKEICHLEDGAHFGEVCLVYPDLKRVTSVIAIEVCELFRLDKSDFIKAIMPYPDLLENIKRIAAERLESVELLDEQIEFTDR